MAAVQEIYSPGLEGVIAGETAVSTIDNDQLAYRGYRIDDLAKQASFEECAYLLLHDDLPNKAQLDAFRAATDKYRKLPPAVIDAIRSIPKSAGGMDVLRTAVSMCGHFDPTNGGETRADLVTQATHVLAVVPSIVAARMRLLEGKTPIEPRPGLSHAAQFFHMAFERTPSTLEEKILNLTFILYAEHEFNASTFAARVTTSTLSDLYSAIVTGIGTLKGPLHGGANEEAIKLINQFKTGPEARDWVVQGLQTKAKIMGFGHRVYKNGDERAHILQPYVYELGKARNEMWKCEVYDAIRNTMMEKKQIHPNVDYPCGLVYFFMNLPTDIYTPLFVASRVTGWSAHIIEQFTNNRLIRPRSRYVGPALRAYRPVSQR